ncbi:MAG: DUF4382 domain-containing protein [Candidatus Acidiferrales bacterium]
MKWSKCVQSFLAILPLLLISACSGGGSMNSTTPPPQQSGSIFTVATDAPLPSVVSCQVNVTGVTVNNGSTDVSVLSQAELVDFAQLSGLHQLVDLTSVPTGTYVSATVTIANPVIGFIDTTQNPPAINTINGTLSTNMVTVTFKNPFTVSNGDLVGLRMEFDLRKSLAVDNNGQVTGTINPMFQMKLLDATDSQVSIDDFAAGVVGVTGNNSFTVQGPHGRQWNVSTDDSTVFDDPNEPISGFTTNTIVLLTGQLDPVSHAIDASEVDVVSDDDFYFSGLLTSVRPPSGPATQADLYVRDELPAVNGISPGDITTLDLNGTEKYRIGRIKLPLTTLLFNNSAMAAGQRVSIGGDMSTTNGTTTLTPHRVVLRRQGQAGTLAGNVVIQNGNNGSFQLNDNWTAGILLPQPLTVMTTDATNFINLSGLSALQGQSGTSLRVVGFVLINPATSQPVLVAGAVEELSD